MILLSQTSRFGEEASDGWYKLNTEMRHEEIASTISATRVSVFTAIGGLRNQGFLEGARGYYQLNIPALSSYLEEL